MATKNKASSFEAQMTKQFGEGTIFSFDMSDREAIKVFPVPTSIPSMDYASGIGGLPLGRIVELYGPESSGKSTICLKTVASFQEMSKLLGHKLFGKKALYIDAEHALDPIHMEALGVDLSSGGNLLINQPESGEQAFDIAEAACLSGEVGMIVIDSAAALVPMKETEESMDYNPIGLQARMMSQGLRKLSPVAKKNDVLVIFVNQIRMKVGVIHGRFIA